MFSWHVAKHVSPLWGEQADALVLADISARGLVPKYESLPAIAEPHDRFRIACVPFFAQDLALGDVVSVDLTSRKRPPVIAEVVEASGHTVFRVWFGKDAEPLTRLECEQRLLELDARVEKQSENLFAVDAASDRVAAAVFDYLDAAEADSRLAFETGHTS